MTLLAENELRREISTERSRAELAEADLAEAMGILRSVQSFLIGEYGKPINTIGVFLARMEKGKT